VIWRTTIYGWLINPFEKPGNKSVLPVVVFTSNSVPYLIQRDAILQMLRAA
jgi:hypothetical protein